MKSSPLKTSGQNSTNNKTTLPPDFATPVAAAEILGVSIPSSSRAIDIEALSIPANYGERFAVTKVLTTVHVKKPNKSIFIRVKVRDEFLVFILEDKEAGIIYALTPQIAEMVPESARPVRLHRATDRQGNQFLIPLPLPGEDGRRNAWHESLKCCIARAEHNWVRVIANMSGGCYDMHEAQSDLGEPEWSDHTMQQLVEIAFRGKIISKENDTVIQQLLGRA
jgi:hypothetical protein